MPNPQIVVSGADESDPKAPLAENEEEEFGDPVPGNVQATTALVGILAGILLTMGLTSSEWVYAVDDYYHQGLFIFCAVGGLNETASGSGSGSGSGSSSSSSASASDESGESQWERGCRRIDLENQSYTMLVALFCAVALSSVVFSTMLAFLGSWVQDIDSKRKVYRLSLYLMIVSIVANFLSLVVYSVNFDDVIEEGEPLGPFDKDDVDELVDWDDWSFGWSFKIDVVGLLAQICAALAIGYGLLLFPIEEVVEEEEAAAAAGGDK